MFCARRGKPTGNRRKQAEHGAVRIEGTEIVEVRIRYRLEAMIRARVQDAWTPVAGTAYKTPQLEIRLSSRELEMKGKTQQVEMSPKHSHRPWWYSWTPCCWFGCPICPGACTPPFGPAAAPGV